MAKKRQKKKPFAKNPTKITVFDNEPHKCELHNPELGVYNSGETLGPTGRETLPTNNQSEQRELNNWRTQLVIKDQ